jgi:BMFP domain-containing protein YqiC
MHHGGAVRDTRRTVQGRAHDDCALSLEAMHERRMKMKPNEAFQDIQSKIGDLFRNSPAKDVERNVKAMLTQGFARLDLVTREEFDIQAQVLARTRARLEELERRVAMLEQKLSAPEAN